MTDLLLPLRARGRNINVRNWRKADYRVHLGIPTVATHPHFPVVLREAVAIARVGSSAATGGEDGGSPPNPITVTDAIVIVKSNALPT